METVSRKELIAQQYEEKKRNQHKEERRKKLTKWIIIGITVVLLIVGFGWVIKESNKPLPGIEVSDQGRGHIPQKEWENFFYNSNPPTSGQHDAVWTKAGIYEDVQADGHLVHSLEHGYVILSYNCTKVSEKGKAQSAKDCDTLKKQLAEIANIKLWKIIVVPRPQLDVPLAVTAWNQIEKFEKIDSTGLKDLDKEKIQAFIQAFQNHGPEVTAE